MMLQEEKVYLKQHYEHMKINILIIREDSVSNIQ